MQRLRVNRETLHALSDDHSREAVGGTVRNLAVTAACQPQSQAGTCGFTVCNCPTRFPCNPTMNTACISATRPY